MNILHLKYAVEVEKTGSITQAAENLYMGQPNLSKAIKELESSIGVTIFKRTTKGVEVTRRGKELLSKAKGILNQIEKLEEEYDRDKSSKLQFSISIPRASYIAYSVVNFLKKLDQKERIEVNYKETNSMEAISQIIEGEYNLGIIRYQARREDYYAGYLRDRNLCLEPIQDFKYVALMSKNARWANKERVTIEELCEGIEIVHGDLAVPFLSVDDATREDEPTPSRRIYIYERGSQFELLSGVQNTFMWVSPVPEELLAKNNLTQCFCDASKNTYRDALVYKKDYRFNEIDKMFIEELKKVCF